MVGSHSYIQGSNWLISFLDPGFSFLDPGFSLVGSHFISRVGLVPEQERFLFSETVFNRRYKRSGGVALGQIWVCLFSKEFVCNGTI